MFTKFFTIRLLVFLIIFVQLSCTTKPKKEGKIKLLFTEAAFATFKDKKMFLGYFPHLIDSVVVTQRILYLDPNRSEINYNKLYKILYWDENNGNRYLRPIGFQTPYGEKPTVFSHFLIEDDDIEIRVDEEDIVKNSYFKGSQRNDPYFKEVYLSYSVNTDPFNRANILKNNLGIIRQYPSSFIILEQLYKNREKFSVDEIKQQVALFEKCAETQILLEALEAYYAHAGKINKFFPKGIALPDSNGISIELPSIGSYQLMIFWASWCGPCRAEIPELKKIFTEYNSKGLQIISISIDSDWGAWKAAMEKEKMPWPQYIANGSDLKKMEQYFTLSAIPATFLFSQDGKVVKQFRGYPNNFSGVIDSLYNKSKQENAEN